MKLKDAWKKSYDLGRKKLWKKSYDQLRQHIKKEKHYFANKGRFSQSYGFSTSHVWLWELDYKESWTPNYWCFWTVMLEKTLESPLDSKEIQLVHPKGEYPWIFIGRTDVEAETLILWLPDEKTWLIRKDPGAGKSANHHLNLSESVTIPSVITMKSSKDCKNSKNVTQSHELSKGSWKNGAFRLACH